MAKPARKPDRKLGLKTALGSSLLFGAAWALGGLSATGCQPPVPASPSFEADVRPIFMSHCVRCHGAGPDGGAINTATQPTGPDAAGLASETVDGQTMPTSPYYLNEYDPPNRTGAYFLAKSANGLLLTEKIHGVLQPPMPPPPAPLLNDWELKVIDAWILNPICSNSPNPDPSICPPDAGQ
jgi:mono/diheme cytochrome c family protein